MMLSNKFLENHIENKLFHSPQLLNSIFQLISGPTDCYFPNGVEIYVVP